MSFPISLQKLRSSLLDKIPVPYSGNEICAESSKTSVPMCGSSANFEEFKYEHEPSESNDASYFANSSFTKTQRSRGSKLAIGMAHSKSLIDISRQREYPSPAPSVSSRGDSCYDYTQFKSTYTSNLRCKLARNEPIPSHYYSEHMERYGKPPFVWGVRKSSDYDDDFRSRRPSSKFEFSY